MNVYSSSTRPTVSSAPFDIVIRRVPMYKNVIIIIGPEDDDDNKNNDNDNGTGDTFGCYSRVVFATTIIPRD